MKTSIKELKALLIILMRHKDCWCLYPPLLGEHDKHCLRIKEILKP